VGLITVRSGSSTDRAWNHLWRLCRFVYEQIKRGRPESDFRTASFSSDLQS
jgi:hypothetical protein